jgi:hypothetical protein
VRLSWILISLLVSGICHADGLSGIPSINEVPAFWGMLGNNPMYHDAAFKAQEAFLVQTDIMAQYNMITSYLSGRLTDAAKSAENKVALVIDEDTPLKHEQVFLGIALSYSIFVKKEVTQKFRNPWLRGVSHSITVSQNTQSINVQIPF